MSDIIYHLAAGKSHEKATERLHAALTKLGFSNVQIADVYDLVIENFDSEDFIFGRRLLEPSDNLVWQSVYIGPGAEDLRRRYDHRNVAESQEEAFGFLLEEIDYLRLEVSGLIVEKDLIEIRGPEGLIARVEPICFEASDSAVLSRVERSLKGLQIYGQRDKIVRELRAIPGLGCLVEPDDRSRKIHGSAFIKTPASFASMLRRMLEQLLNIQVKQHQAQELIAAFFGASNWQQLIHHSEEDRCWCSPSAVVVHDGDDQEVKSIRYFRNSAMALWELGRAVKLWDGPQLIGSFSHMSHGVPYIPLDIFTGQDGSIADGIGRDDHALSIYGPPVVAAGGQNYVDAAVAILRADNPAVAFEAYQGDDPIESANPRMGIAPEKVMRFAGHVFTIRESGGEDMLFLECFGATQKRLSEHSVRISSASIGLDPATGGYSIYHDGPQIPLDGLADDEREVVLKWAGIKYPHWTLTRTLGPGRSLN